MRIVSLLIGVYLSLLPGAPFAADSPRKFDMFGLLSCKEERARVDNYANELQRWPEARAVIIIYAGVGDTVRGEVIARLSGMKDYLVKKRGIEAGRVIVLNGGYRRHLGVELWMTSPLLVEVRVLVVPDDSIKSVQFKSGRVKKWEYNCGD